MERPTTPPTPSSLYNVIPDSIQSHIPRILSFSGALAAGLRSRRSASSDDIPTFSNHKDQDSATRPSTSSSGTLDYFNDDTMEKSLSTARRQDDNTTMHNSSNDASGISWAYAAQGLAMLHICLQQQQSPYPTTTSVQKSTESTSLSRNLYIHSLTYLLRALPPTLTLDERTSLQSALPNSIVADPRPTTIILQQTAHQPPSSPRLQTPPSALHRFTATLTLNTILLVSLLTPYFITAIRTAYEYEKKHKLLLRIYQALFSIISLFFAQTKDLSVFWVDLARQLCIADDGRLGKAVQKFVGWLVLGVSEGFYQGVGEGVGRLRGQDGLAVWGEERQQVQAW